MRYSRIIGTGGYLPPQVFTNADWEKRVDTSNEWIVDRTGIHSRRIAGSGETASFMAVEAAKAALEMANIKPESIQLIICATATPDTIFPSNSCRIQASLGCTCPAFDVSTACAGFVYALSIADQFIKAGTMDTVLIVGTELMSRLVDWSDRDTCVLFGDGAGCCILQASQTPGIIATNLYADGKEGDLLFLENMQLVDHTRHIPGVTPTDNNSASLEQSYPFVKMNGKKVFKIAVNMFYQLVKDILAQNNLSEKDIDWLIPHQANIRIIQALAEKLNLPMEKVVCTVEKHSNTSSASIPLALDVAVRDGRVKKGQNLIFEAFGGGLTWGSALVKF